MKMVDGKVFQYHWSAGFIEIKLTAEKFETNHLYFENYELIEGH